jgi:predicted O-linked N-acetylglucosamine transferase (SPINDLY family)
MPWRIGLQEMSQFTLPQALDLAQHHHKAGRLREAEILYRQILALQPAHAAANLYLGVIAHQAGHHPAAVDLIQKAIAANPRSAQAHNNLGLVLEDLGQLDNAMAAFDKARELNPGLAEAHLNIGNVMKVTGRLDDAIAAYRQALAIKPGYTDAHSNIIYLMHFHPGFDAHAIGEECRRFASRYALGTAQAHTNHPDPNRRLRIGYVSPDFRDHVVGRNVLPLIRQHDRRHFEIVCYAQVFRGDALTNQFQQLADRWVNISAMSDDEAALRMREDRIDILVDLALHMGGGRLQIFSRKPAPLQVTFAGYPGGTGLSAIDYRLTDPHLDPPGMDQSLYVERTIRLPDSFWCYDPLDCGDISIGPSPATANGFVTFGCLNNPCKINESVLAVWSKVLSQIENSRLIQMSPGGSHRVELTNRFAAHGVDPSRIQFVPKQSRRAYLAQYHQIDIGLDTFPYNGHTTSLDALWMGVPIVTLVGSTAVGRAGWSQLSNLGLQELAAENSEQFVEIAAALARELPRLQTLRSTLRPRMEQSPLMNASRFACNIEAAYRHMWRNWCEAPQDAANPP